MSSSSSGGGAAIAISATSQAAAKASSSNSSSSLFPPRDKRARKLWHELQTFKKAALQKGSKKRELKLPQGWTERVLRLEGNPDHGKTYFVNEQTDELCIDKLPPGSSKLCGVVFGKFGTCFTQYNNVCTVEEIPRE